MSTLVIPVKVPRGYCTCRDLSDWIGREDHLFCRYRAAYLHFGTGISSLRFVSATDDNHLAPLSIVVEFAAGHHLDVSTQGIFPKIPLVNTHRDLQKNQRRPDFAFDANSFTGDINDVN